MKTLIILAHPSATSFNAQWAHASAEACSGEVLWSDLYAMGFDPIECAAHYGRSSDSFDPLKSQFEAAESNALPNDVTNEINKLREADRVIFHFPLWWFGPPAILKGWTERCLAHGEMHRSDARFDSGLCKGKEVLFCVTTGASAIESGPAGKEGDTNMHLWALAYTLRYCGFTIKQPLLLHGIHGYFEGDSEKKLEQRCKAMLAGQKQAIDGWSEIPNVRFNADTDFDEEGQLKLNSPSYTPFIRHTIAAKDLS
ncbi:NAD(P)H-dependent oxidoreductase [Vibrio algarum]|uniref:NAD(P)H-dependent oxidoreductase n=1 Tax=Vibrio algarum TaxID=3020714 RepID=A0ABT4YX97_9VIBR|nr:NAD(P)H-dependent oxidoreductase [Vibrio sp. KJ40-1]MDB1125985.1 NAD(P)H-dependent oxidoreductase [Vibrio sp. KJ40-1]